MLTEVQSVNKTKIRYCPAFNHHKNKISRQSSILMHDFTVPSKNQVNKLDTSYTFSANPSKNQVNKLNTSYTFSANSTLLKQTCITIYV